MPEKPILYLDVDGVLLHWRDRAHSWGILPPAGREFLLWAHEAFEVHWLTAWCVSGTMASDDATRLAGIFGVAPDLLESFQGLPWSQGNKANGILWSEHLVSYRPFVWVEDEILEEEMFLLTQAGVEDSFYLCDCQADHTALAKMHADLKAWVEEGCQGRVHGAFRRMLATTSVVQAAAAHVTGIPPLDGLYDAAQTVKSARVDFDEQADYPTAVTVARRPRVTL